MTGCARSGCSRASTAAAEVTDAPVPPPTPANANANANANVDVDDDDLALFQQANTRCHSGAGIEALEKGVKDYQYLESRVVSGESSMDVCDIRWRLASVMFFVSETVSSQKTKLEWIREGEGVAEKVIADCGDRVEGYYYAAVLKGRRAEVSGNGFKALRLVKEVLTLGKKAAAIDESFENAAPLRLLAMLYAKAPSWPASVGDIDLALQTAERALEISDYPMNHLTMAEVLIEDDAFARAREELNLVLSAKLTGHWARDGVRWRPYAATLLSEISDR